MFKVSFVSVIVSAAIAAQAMASDYGLQGLPFREMNPSPDFSQPAPRPLPAPTPRYIMPMPDNNGGVDFHGRSGNFRLKISPNNPGGSRVEGDITIQLP